MVAACGALWGRGLFDAILRTVSRMPVERLHLLAGDLASLAGAGYRPRLVAANLARAFPEADAEALAREFYARFAEEGVEMVRLLAMDKGELLARVRCEGEEALRDGNAVLLMAHRANMIWAACALASRIPAAVSMVYKPPHAPAMRELLLALAKRFDIELVPVKDVRRKLVKKGARRGRLWTLVADQRPGKDHHHAEFCGQRTRFFLGPERIARALGWPVFYLSSQRTGAGAYLSRVEKIAEPPYKEKVGFIVERYAAKLQADLDDAPADWLWSHDRWRGG